MKRILLLSLFVVLLASASAFAQVREGDINFGNDARSSGYWGITYKLGLDDDHGTFASWFHIDVRNNVNRYNRQVTGAYYEGGTSVNTRFGARLGVNYSPYTASFHGNSEALGVRIWPYEIGPVTLDFAYIFGAHSGETHAGPVFGGEEITRQDIMLGATTQVGNANLRGAFLRRESGGDFFWNWSILLENSELYPGITFNAVYASWAENADWLYQVTADWVVEPNVLLVRAGYRDSEIVDVNSNAVRGSAGGTAEVRRYISNGARDQILNVYNWNNAFNVGVTTWFDFNGIDNRLDVDYSNTNPRRRDDFDDELSARLQSNYNGFSIDQRLAMLVPDAATVNPEAIAHDRSLPRWDYRLAVTSPEYELPYNITARGLFNYDWDQNYIAESRSHAVIGVRFDTRHDLYVFRNVDLGAIVLFDMPGVTTPAVVQDPVKFVLRAAYNAPNGVRFRVDYQSSKDFALSNRSVHDEQIYHRYNPYAFHDVSGNSRDRFDGLRVVIAIPF